MVLFFQKDIVGLQEEISAGRHGLPGIHKQIQQHLLNLSPVHVHRPQIFLQFFVNDNFFFRATKHSGTLINQGVYIRGSDFIFTPSCEAQNLTGQVRAPFNVIFHVVQKFLVGMFIFEIHHHQ